MCKHTVPFQAEKFLTLRWAPLGLAHSMSVTVPLSCFIGDIVRAGLFRRIKHAQNPEGSSSCAYAGNSKSSYP